MMIMMTTSKGELYEKKIFMGRRFKYVQAEGGYLEDGKGLNVYDTLVVTPEPGIKPMFCTTDVATDHYHHWKEDIDYMAEMGFKHIVFLLFGREFIHWEMKKSQMKKD